MKKRVLVLLLVVVCATTLVFGLSMGAFAEDPPPEEPPVELWQIRTIPTPVSNVTPSFVSMSEDYIAWTGAELGGYSTTYIFDLVTGVNNAIAMTYPGNYYNPCADGPWVVFQGGRAGAYDDIYLYDTASGVVQPITHNTEPGDYNDWNPRIDSSRVVWEKDTLGTNATPGIYLYDVNSGTTTLLIEGDQYRTPDIWGNYVVCVKGAGTGTGSEIILYDLNTKDMTSIASNIKSNEHPRIDSGMVVWASGDVWTPGAVDIWRTYQIQLYDIAVKTTTTLSAGISGNTNPSIKGEEIAWESTEPSGIWSYNYVTEYEGFFTSQGDIVKSPEVGDVGVAWYGSQALYYALPESEATDYPDVPIEHPYATAIDTMTDMGIIEGYENGYFGMNDLVTRQQFAKMIVLTMAEFYPNLYTPTLYDTYDWADSYDIQRVEGQLYPYHYIAKAALTGLVLGYPDNTFRPLNNITRQQVITMIVRASSYLLELPPPNWQGVLGYTDKEHGERIRLAEYNGLLSGIVGPTGSLAAWDTTGNATRGEVAQMLYNLLGKITTAD